MKKKNKEVRIMVSFGKTLETIRESRGITKTEMARMLDLSLPAYSLYEKGEREPKLSNLKRIANILEVSVDELLEENLESDFERAKRIWQKQGYKIEESNESVFITPPENELQNTIITILKPNFMRLTNKIRKVIATYFPPHQDKTFLILANLYSKEYEGREKDEEEFKKLFPNTKYPLPALNEESTKFENNL